MTILWFLIYLIECVIISKAVYVIGRIFASCMLTLKYLYSAKNLDHSSQGLLIISL